MKILFNLLILLICLPALAESEWDAKEEPAAALPEIEVYRSPDCQCCHRWIEHLERHHFKVVDHITLQMVDVKEKLGVPRALASCHTAVVNGYIIEGHVPAEDIIHLLTEKSELKGLSVPQMPVGTPGMEVVQRKDNFAVIGFDQQNKFSLFNRYQVGSDHLYHSQPIQE